MTGAELKQALFNKTPVMHNGIRYQRVCEIVYRVPEDKLIVSAGLLDANGNCIVYAQPDKVSPIPSDDTKEEKTDEAV
mgnify:CR=1 FL=1